MGRKHNSSKKKGKRKTLSPSEKKKYLRIRYAEVSEEQLIDPDEYIDSLAWWGYKRDNFQDELLTHLFEIYDIPTGLRKAWGLPFRKHQGLCLEPQDFPNAPNDPSFSSTVLKPGEIYNHQITYKFDTVT